MRKTVLLPIFLTLAACSSGPENPLEAAREAIAAQDLNRARISLTAALEDDHRNVALLELLAEVQLRMGHGAGAQATINRMAKLGAKGTRIEQLQAETELLMGNPEAALTRLANDGSEESVRIRAAALLALDRPGEAQALWKSVMDQGIDREGLRMAFDYGSYLLITGDTGDAWKVLEQMRRVGSNQFETLLLEARIALASGDAKAAEVRFAWLVKRFPHRIEPVCGRGQAMDELGQIGPALTFLDKADAAMPGQACIAEIKLSLLSQKGEWAKIRDLLQGHEMTLDPTSHQGLTYAEALLRLGQPEQARALFGKAHELSPSNPYARLMLAETLLATGDPARALEKIAPLAQSVLAGERELKLAEAAAREAGDPSADALAARLASGSWRTAAKTNQAGLSAVSREDWKGAIAAWQQLDPQGSDPEVQRRLAFALGRAGRGEEAIVVADRLLLSDPANADLLYLAGSMRSQSGIDREKGVALLERALKRQPTNVQYRQSLEKAKAATG